jgi:hypothetical protein
MTAKDADALPAWLGSTRLAIGLAQGVALYGLTQLRPADSEALYVAAWVVMGLIPVVVVGGLGALRWQTLAVWTVLATALAAGLAWYEIERNVDGRSASAGPLAIYVTIPLLLFVGHHLVAAGDEARRWIAPYERYFDLGWRHGAQLALAILFTGAFWAVLLLGAALFALIGINFLRDLINNSWFSLPATCTVFALAIHLTDLRSGLVRGARALGLVLLSWLLPAMTGLATAFFIALPFTGLEPLWATRAATAILLSAAATLVVLVNAAYQDGVNAPNIFLRWSARVAALLMTPLAALAAYALYLRIDQYGLTPDRVFALAVLAIGSCYAVAYAIGAVWPRWMKPLEIGNIASAVVVMAVGIALFTPIADPARLSVDDQMRRLASGRVAPEQFDVMFLRFEGARYGQEALRRLAADTSSEARRALGERAQAALDQEYRWQEPERGARSFVITMRPEGAVLPEGFASDRVTGVVQSLCVDAAAPCEGYLMDLNSDGSAELIVGAYGTFYAYARTSDASWIQVGQFAVDADGQDALRRGHGRVVPALVGDLMIGDKRITLNRQYQTEWPAVGAEQASPGDAGAPNR